MHNTYVAWECASIITGLVEIEAEKDERVWIPFVIVQKTSFKLVLSNVKKLWLNCNYKLHCLSCILGSIYWYLSSCRWKQ